MRLLKLAAAGALLFIYSAPAAHAQATATVIQTCGTPLSPLSLGQLFPLMMDTTGHLCTNAAGGSANASVGPIAGGALPASATYVGMNVSSVFTGLTGSANGLQVDGSAVTQPVSNGGTFPTQLTGSTNNINSIGTGGVNTIVLPTGAATSSNQSTEITDLGNIANLGVGAAALATNHVSCPITTETSIVSARTGAAGTGRASVTITNMTGTQVVDIGNTGVTTGSGIELPPIQGASITLNTTAAIHCIATTAAQTMTFVESY